MYTKQTYNFSVVLEAVVLCFYFCATNCSSGEITSWGKNIVGSLINIHWPRKCYSLKLLKGSPSPDLVYLNSLVDLLATCAEVCCWISSVLPSVERNILQFHELGMWCVVQRICICIPSVSWPCQSDTNHKL